MEATYNQLITIVTSATLGYLTVYFGFIIFFLGQIGDLTEIRNKKVSEISSRIFERKNTDRISFFELIDDISADNKSWLLNPERSNKSLNYSVWLLGVVGIIYDGWLLIRSNLLDDVDRNSFSLFDKVILFFFIGILFWAVYNLYWEWDYFKKFRLAEKKLGGGPILKIKCIKE